MEEIKTRGGVILFAGDPLQRIECGFDCQGIPFEKKPDTLRFPNGQVIDDCTLEEFTAWKKAWLDEARRLMRRVIDSAFHQGRRSALEDLKKLEDKAARAAGRIVRKELEAHIKAAVAEEESP